MKRAFWRFRARVARRWIVVVSGVLTAVRTAPLAYSTLVPAFSTPKRIFSIICAACSPSRPMASLSTGSSWVSRITSVIVVLSPYWLSVAVTSTDASVWPAGVTPSVSATGVLGSAL